MFDGITSSMVTLEAVDRTHAAAFIANSFRWDSLFQLTSWLPSRLVET